MEWAVSKTRVVLSGMDAFTSLPGKVKSSYGRTSNPSANHVGQFHATISSKCPPGLTTRRISANAFSGSGMCSTTHTVHAASKELSGKGILVADPTTNGLWYFGATVGDKSSPV